MWWWQSQAFGGAFNSGAPEPAELGTSCAYAFSADVRLAAASATRLPSLRNVRRLILDAAGMLVYFFAFCRSSSSAFAAFSCARFTHWVNVAGSTNGCA